MGVLVHAKDVRAGPGEELSPTLDMDMTLYLSVSLPSQRRGRCQSNLTGCLG
jgi:hypothetical protein